MEYHLRIILFLGINLFLQTHSLLAQQNLFNIPSGDITPKRKVFYQHQFNFYRDITFESKSHFVYGLGKGIDVGINLINLKFDLGRNRRNLIVINDLPTYDPVSPMMLATFQKGFKPHKKFKVNIGTQVGTNIIERGNGNHLGHFTYTLATYEPIKGNHTRIVFGSYFTNNAFVGRGNDFGYMLGYEIPLNKRWYLMGDFISGNHSNSVAVLGGMYNISKNVQLCFGALLPNFNNVDTTEGFVLELNLLGWDFWQDNQEELRD
ncbi:MAG: hypothetical protein NZ551_11815 [Microscillaceae bacterium]|nr:hypothetical protein [Microscillaceae bacterium]MDW8461881.1 hypothetical protein [Cytophagales bacterium]